jgi:prepilin-type N-terminal cleavage/methylation domain-containing protein
MLFAERESVMSHTSRINRSQSVTSRASASQQGFSLLETMIVMVVMTVIMGAVFQSINLTQRTNSSEQVKLDLTQQAREFMDQLSRDLRNVGYPSSRNMWKGSLDSNGNDMSSPQSHQNGAGLLYVDYKTLYIAGDVDGVANADGTAQVKIIKYTYVQDGTNCPCLRRTEYLRSAYLDPYTDAQGTAVQPQMEIQGVQNGTSWTDAIFTAYDSTTQQPFSTAVNELNNGTDMANINSMRVVLAVQSPYKDGTGAYPFTRVVSTIALHNCTQAAQFLTLSC